MSLARSRLLQICRVPVYQVRNAAVGYWNKDFQPGFNIPKTPEEKAAVAKKYNLLPEEYQPEQELHDMGIGCGDYPKVPDVYEWSKDIYYPYDLPSYRMNYGEPRSLKMLYLTGEKCDPYYYETNRWKTWQMFLALCTPVVLLASFAFSDLKFFPPVAKRHYYNDGMKHYSYEPVE
ncbi:NADH dehydrogenase [ubiquinone] 1 beta subcomplex subunit 8, mitochondrial [Nilaparvata lugens]|uniref:NADH dehydrogenase [ubiquinone] 1 beta subcomplex subunit 8, mitochondrial n=1 Tax=Nilaparvata lugens TaxID=108931 RepID=UPI000B995A88|nr:NADH dehydrogenase [ubiquinone] 1 beta subcomplex subunit 8, mitochondrial [Nilaparvata lugens]